MKFFKRLSAIILMTFVAVASMVSLTANAKTAIKGYGVLIINFDPTFTVNKKTIKQHELASSCNDPDDLMTDWNDPHQLAEDFAKKMPEVSYGNVNYEIVETIDLNEMPRCSTIKKAPYTTSEYYKQLMSAAKETNGSYWTAKGWKDYGFDFDYDYYFNKYKVYDRINSGEIDEVWIFAGPMVGVTLHETIMVGKNAFWVNGTPLKKDCRNFIVYGFNYERGVGEMLEDAGHRQESIMDNVFGVPNYNKNYSDYNDWEKFTAYECVAKGKSGVGDVHHAPNSLTSDINDHDWQRTNRVLSYCDTWYNYPDLSGTAKTIGREEWGGDDDDQYLLKHHEWWFRHIPHAEGRNAKTNLYNNWWYYFTLDYLNTNTNIVEPYHIATCSFSSVGNYTYTGSAIKPAVTVKHGSKTLKAGTDYTISYKNNTNVGTATITITGKGNYTATKNITFKINPKDISQLTYSAIKDQIYTGKAINPALTINYGNITLRNNIDYTYNPANNTNVGQAIITIIGHGNYTGLKSVFFNIKPKNISGLSYSAIKDQIFTGKAINPTLTIKYGNITLKNGTDYTYNPGNNVNAGKAIITIIGHGNYTGIKSVFFNIKPKDVSGLSYSSIPNQKYTGKAINPALTIKYGNITLRNGIDYTYNPANNVKKGKAIITIIGHGNYTGLKSVFFNIV